MRAAFWEYLAELHPEREELNQAIPCWERVLTLTPAAAGATVSQNGTKMSSSSLLGGLAGIGGGPELRVTAVKGAEAARAARAGAAGKR